MVVDALAAVLADLDLAERPVPEPTGEDELAVLSSPLAVGECGVAAVSACLIAAAELAHARSGRRPRVSLDAGHVAAAVRSEAWLRDPTGRPLRGFAPLSRLWRCADGWVRTHANYGWHRDALLRAFRVNPDLDPEQAEHRLGNVLANRAALEIEESAYQAGALAVAARTVEQWRDSSAGRAVAAVPLVAVDPLGVGAAPLPPFDARCPRPGCGSST